MKHFHYHIERKKNSSAITVDSLNTFEMISICECLIYAALPLPYQEIPIRETGIVSDLIPWPLCMQLIGRTQTSAHTVFFSVTLWSHRLAGPAKNVTFIWAFTQQYHEQLDKPGVNIRAVTER